MISKPSTTITIFSTNAAGLVKGKMDSLTSEVKAIKANIVTIEETHSIRKGKIIMPEEFVVFEAIRKAKHGGTMCAVHSELNPKLIDTYEDLFEMVVVEVEANKKGIRIITGCGPQENWDEVRRLPFFIALESKMIKADLAGKSIILEMDSNSKLGPEFIRNDPNKMSPNGRILSKILERHALIVANGSERFQGLVTRERTTTQRTEKSCIDILVLSSDLNKHFKSFIVDE